MSVELVLLRSKFDEAQERIIQLRELIAGKREAKKNRILSKFETIAVTTIARRPGITACELSCVLREFQSDDVKTPTDVCKVIVSRARKKLKPYNVTIFSKPWFGYWIDDPDLKRLKEIGVL
jgi:hypothetical protein